MKNNTLIFMLLWTIASLFICSKICLAPMGTSAGSTVGSGVTIIPPKGVTVETIQAPSPIAPIPTPQPSPVPTPEPPSTPAPSPVPPTPAPPVPSGVQAPQPSAPTTTQPVAPAIQPTPVAPTTATAPIGQLPTAQPTIQQPTPTAAPGVQPVAPAAQLPGQPLKVPTAGTPIAALIKPQATIPVPALGRPGLPIATSPAPLGFGPPSAATKTEFQKLLEGSQAQKAKEVGKETKKKKEKKPLKTKGDLIDFSFDQTPLIDVIKRYTEKKKLNLILPQPTTSIRQQITFKPDRLLTLKEAEKYLYLFLDYAGYTVSPGPEFAIVIKNKEASKNTLPLYVFDATSAVKIDDLPESDAPVRAVYYFSNLKVTDAADNPVIKILQDMLSGTTADYIFTDAQSNGVIITDKSRIVRGALQILRELDSVSSRYVLTTLQLYNASASSISDLLKSQILAVQPVGFGVEKPSAGVGSYFSSNMKVVADDRRNTLIIWGKEAAVNRLKEFVREYMDAPLESGKSVFHTYDLKYLDSELFAPVLDQVVKGQGIGAGDQATAMPTAGPRRFFEGVVVRAETYKPVESPQQSPGQQAGDFDQSTTSATAGTVYRGGNRLLIAAQPSDWDQIKNIIDQLDIPQRQVILEVLICDYTRNETKLLRSQVRNLERMDFRPGVGFQAANLNAATTATADYGILPNSDTNPQNIVGDLLRIFAAGNASLISPPATPTNVDQGSLVLTLNDPAGTGIWGIFNLLNSFGTAKILTHPYLVALNNTNASIQNTDIRRQSGDASSSTGGAITVNVQDYAATVSVSLTPRISSADRLNIEVIIQIQEFSNPNPATFQRMSRTLQTNVNMSSPNQVLVLGGITRLTKNVDCVETPILGRIPIIQWFFRGTELVTEETELGIFIRPTIIEPKLRDEMNAYTRSKIRSGSRTADVYPLGNQKDPIVKFFFGEVPPEEAVIESYMQEANIIPAPEIIKPESPAELLPEKVIPGAVQEIRIGK